MTPIQGAVAVVTGGGNGLGRTYCEALARAGARVVVADVDEVSAEATADVINEAAGERRAAAVRVDVTSEADTTAMAAAAVDAFGGLDVLVNNAGTYPHVPFDDIDYEAWRTVFAVNLDSVFLCSKAVLPQMKAQGSGKVINVATNLVWSGLAEMVHYISAKAGVVGFTRSLARAVGPFGITVNAIAPGAVVPERLSEAAQPKVQAIIDYQCVRRGQQPSDLVGAMLFLSSPASDFISGQVLTVDGGLTMH